MSRKKLFIDNIFAYGFINVLNKIVPFLLLPVITRMLPNASDYGVFNIYSLVIGFGTPFAILGLHDAIFREYFEKDDQQYKYNVTTTAQRIILLSSILISAMLVLLNQSISSLFFGESTYGNVVMLAGIGVFLGANVNPIQAPTRMQNQRKIFIFSGLIGSVSMYGLSIILIYKGFSYFGLIYSNIVTTLLMVVFFWIRNKQFFLRGSFNKKIAKNLFGIGIPLLPTFLIYWIYDSIDKIMITNMLGTTEMGIYSIGSKMAQLSQLIYAGFAGGYSYFKYKTMNDADQIYMNSKLFEYLGVVSFGSFVLIYPFVSYIFKILFEGAYEQGYIVASYLFLSPLLLMLFQVVGSQFIVAKKSYLSSITLMLGAIVNVILNFFLIPYIGIEGAAIATLVGYSVSIILASIVAIKYKLLVRNIRFLKLSILIFVYLLVNRCLFYNVLIINIILTFIVIGAIVIKYKNEVVSLIKKGI